MLFTTSGSTLEIGAARVDWSARPVTDADFTDEAWIIVGGVSSLGRVEGDWTTQDISLPDGADPDQPQIPTHSKVTRPLKSMQVIAGIMEDDPGQIAVIEAETYIEPYAFRLTLPSGATRRFIALVNSCNHVFDEANAVLAFSFSLLLQSNMDMQA
ncbi:hypothetical protein [Agrobacterium pusense]|uniref:hypothetical protein n=1 Tax=Agrobacterium pusense TaxID=648995 RepID=UPI00289C8B9A|nr:hypothetical protein [Agrobacterium pusense]